MGRTVLRKRNDKGNEQLLAANGEMDFRCQRRSHVRILVTSGIEPLSPATGDEQVELSSSKRSSSAVSGAASSASFESAIRDAPPSDTELCARGDGAEHHSLLSGGKV